MHLVMVVIAVGFVVPRWFDVFIPAVRQGEGDLPYAPNVTLGKGELDFSRNTENGFDNNLKEMSEDSKEMRNPETLDAGINRK